MFEKRQVMLFFRRVVTVFVIGAMTALCMAACGKTTPAVRSEFPLLEIRDAVTRKSYGQWRLENDGEFAVEFVHSVHQSPVREIFRADGRLIRLAAVRFYAFGAGMQSDLEEGQRLSRDGDALVITGFDRSFTELNYIVGTVSDHLLFVNDSIISLRDLCGRNAHIFFRVQ